MRRSRIEPGLQQSQSGAGKNLVEHLLDVVAGVPVAVIVEAARLFEHARQFDAAGAHELDVGLGGFVTIVEGTLLPGLSPEHFVVAIGVKRRVDVDEVDGVGGELLELLQIVATVDDASVEQGRRFRQRVLGATVEN